MQGKQRIFAAICLPVFLLLGSARALASTDAEAVIRQLVDSLVAVAATEPEPDLAERIERLQSVVSAAHDYDRMGRLTVRSFWRDFSAAEQAQFVDAFGRLSVASYASRFATIGPDTLDVLGSEATSDTQSVVHVMVRRADDDDITLDYTMRLSDGEWRIVDVLADGVSELVLRKNEYYPILEADGFAGLLDDIERQIAEF